MKKIILILVIGLIVTAGVITFLFILPTSQTEVAQDIRDALPFGEGDDADVPFTTADTEPDVPLVTESGAPRTNLFQVSNTPVAGAVAFVKNGSLVVRYVDRATGHITDVNLETLEKVKIVNETRPKIYEAHFRPDGSQVLLRSLREDGDIIENISLTLTAPRGTSTSELYSVKTFPLRSDMTEVAVGSNNLFYVLLNTSSISTSNFEGAGSRNLYSSAFYDWRLTSAGNRLIAATRPGAEALGYAYSVNTTNSGLTKLLGPLFGLVAVPDPAGAYVAYSYNDNRVPKFGARNISSGESFEILPATIADKCVWSAQERGVLYCGAPINPLTSGEPENWYKGLTHFSDRIWRFEAEIGISLVMSEPKKEFGVDIDVMNPQLSPEEDYLIFQNKNDLSLWALKLE